MERRFKYVTNRTIPNKAGEENKGKIRVLVRVNSDDAEADYECPECSDKRHVVKEWKRPFNIKCENCGFLMRLPKLKSKKKKKK
ncbi:MAG: hypothetical protein ISS36_00945 [Candidatus Aenigmarchaeota archaeon]|nr:hypothetical protein [Candidatus Aenigmarchaeota archaeon]